MNTHAEVRIDAPTETVWSVMTDVRRWPDWTASVRAVEPLQDGPLQIGSRFRVRQPRLPQALWEVTEIVPGRSFTWVNRSPGLISTGSHSVTTDADGTTVGRLVLDQVGPLQFLVRPFAGLTSRYVRMEAAGLRARSEQIAARG